MRPYDAGGKPLEYDGLLVVRASLTLAKGARFPGYVYYTPAMPAEVGPSYGPLADLQPQIVTPQGQGMFWFGAVAPTPDALADAYRKLGAVAAGVFPVRFASEVPLAAGPISGEIPGFQYIAERKKGWFSKERYVATVTAL